MKNSINCRLKWTIITIFAAAQNFSHHIPRPLFPQIRPHNYRNNSTGMPAMPGHALGQLTPRHQTPVLLLQFRMSPSTDTHTHTQRQQLATRLMKLATTKTSASNIYCINIQSFLGFIFYFAQSRLSDNFIKLASPVVHALPLKIEKPHG